MPLNLNAIGSWSTLGQTQSANTAIVIGIPPYTGPRESGVRLFTVDTGKTMANPSQTALNGYPDWWGEGSAYIKVTDLIVTSGSTQHTGYFLRPKNWTYVASAAAISQAVINIKEDPGVYSTNYRYPSPLATGTAAVADNAIAASDYAAYQLKDGTWVFDKVSSVSTLAITMTTNIPNVTGGGVAANTPFFFFGTGADKDPATGLADPATLQTVSLNQVFQTNAALFNTLHRGDPLIYLNANATAADTVSLLAGLYTKDW